MSLQFIFITLIISIIGGVVLAMATYYSLRRLHGANRLPLHHIKIKSARGVITKLVLNDEQYEQFQSFLNSPDGIFDIGDERNKVFLERRYIASVEVRVR